MIDIGSGGGLPGLPLAIANPATSFTLLDSNGKKMGIVETIAREIGLDNVKTVTSRAESHYEKYDYMLGRAVSNLPNFLSFSSHFIDPMSNAKRIHSDCKTIDGNYIEMGSGLLYLKGGDFSTEIKDAYIEDHSLFTVSSILPIDSDKNILYIPAKEIINFQNNKQKVDAFLETKAKLKRKEQQQEKKEKRLESESE